MANKTLVGSSFVSTLITCIAGCSNGASSQSGTEANGVGEKTDLRSARTVMMPRKGDLHTPAKQSPPQDADAPTCPNPTLGSVQRFGMVSLSGDAVNKCVAGDPSHCAAQPAFVDANDVALDYGNFPFSRDISARYFYAVVAEGFENSGFFQGATGNLSDDVPSAVAGDHGGGDKVSDRTIVVDAIQIPKLFPAAHGTHHVSFPPSQFMTIQLAPFDTTPAGKYVLVLCPTDAMSRCDCAFEAFDILSPVHDAGAGGARGAGGAGGTGGHEASTGGVLDTGGTGHDAGRMCPDM